MKSKLFLFMIFFFLVPNYSLFSQEEQLEVDGAIQISNSDDPTPDPGTIRWNDTNQDFEGYTGSEWKSLTKTEKFWGITPDYVGNENAKLTASDATAADNFGNSASISGDYVILGAVGDDDGGSQSGSAYVFMISTQQQVKLTASDAAAEDQFGWSVSISGDYAIVGAPYDNDGGLQSGSAYVFMRSDTSWTQQAKLTASDAAASDQFGWSVSISGDYAIVSTPYDNDGGLQSGSAYVFMRSDTSWSEQAKLTASDAAASDHFGISVSISGDYAIVGAHRDDDDGSQSGSAYVFRRSGTSWSEQAKLRASDAAAADNFGISVSISDDYAIIGARKDDDGGTDSGSAYVFMRSDTSWSQQAKLTASDAAAADYFGMSVSISDDCVIVGAIFHDDGGSQSGSAYVFMRSGTTWTQRAKLKASDSAAEDFFGVSVSISDAYAIIGAHGDDDGGTDSGSAYIFEKY